MKDEINASKILRSSAIYIERMKITRSLCKKLLIIKSDQYLGLGKLVCLNKTYHVALSSRTQVTELNAVLLFFIFFIFYFLLDFTMIFECVSVSSTQITTLGIFSFTISRSILRALVSSPLLQSLTLHHITCQGSEGGEGAKSKNEVGVL